MGTDTTEAGSTHATHGRHHRRQFRRGPGRRPSSSPRRGDQVVVVGRNPHRLAAAVDQVRAAGDGPRAGLSSGPTSNGSTTSAALAAHLLETYPTIDVLANNAGGMVGEYQQTVGRLRGHDPGQPPGAVPADQPAAGAAARRPGGEHRLATRTGMASLDPDDLVGSADTYQPVAARTGRARPPTSCSPRRRPAAGRTCCPCRSTRAWCAATSAPARRPGSSTGTRRS